MTGSTSGIGFGIASTLAKGGIDILLNGFGDTAEIEKIVDGIKAQYAVRVAYSAADMSQPAEITAMVAQATRELGRVDILANNAGIQHTAPSRSSPRRSGMRCLRSTSRRRSMPSAPRCRR